MDTSKFPRLSPPDAGRLYYCFEIFQRICRKHDITWWITYASLLGAIRHGGIIPWDDDGDVCFDSSSEEKLRQLRPEFQDHGCELVSWWGGYRLSMCLGRKLDRKPGEYDPWPGYFPFIDIFPYALRKGRYTHARRITRFRWFHMRDHFYPDEVFPIRKLPFGPLNLPAPSSGLGYIERLYGRDWNKITYCQHDHFEGKSMKKEIVLLDDLAPAEYEPVDLSAVASGKKTLLLERGQ